MKFKRTSHLFIILSWLISRLWRGIELSRLAIYRVKPKAEINLVSRDHKKFPRGVWIRNEEKLYWIGVNQTTAAMHLRQAVLESN